MRALLDAAGIAYEIDPTLVRGLDYYTRTIFSFVCDALGAQSEIGGGGRYDGLIEQLGGPATPAVGWAAGIERILLALGRGGGDGRAATPSSRSPTTGQRQRAMALAVELRHAGLSAEVDLAGRSLKGQLKHADRIGARRVLILEADGSAQLRDMETGEQRAGRPRQPCRRDDRRRVVSEADLPPARANGYRDTWCGEVLADRVDSEARVAGWVHRRRDHGGLIFIDLRDRTGIVQLVFHPDSSGEAFELAHKLRAEDVLTRGRDRRPALGGDGQPGAADRRGRAQGRRAPSCSPTPRRRPSRSRASPARSARTPACATATSTCAASRCARR